MEHDEQSIIREMANTVAGVDSETEVTQDDDTTTDTVDQEAQATEDQETVESDASEEQELSEDTDPVPTEEAQAATGIDPQIEELQAAFSERIGQQEQTIEKLIGLVERLSQGAPAQTQQEQSELDSLNLDPEERAHIEAIQSTKLKPLEERVSKMQREQQAAAQVAQVESFKAKYATDSHYPYNKIAPNVQKAFNLLNSSDFSTKLEMARHIAIADAHLQELKTKSQSQAKSQVAKKTKQPKADALSQSANPGRLATKDEDQGSGSADGIREYVNGLRSAGYVEEYLTGGS